MVIILDKGTRRIPNYETGWWEHEYDGNTSITFEQPDNEEKKIMHRCIEYILEKKRKP